MTTTSDFQGRQYDAAGERALNCHQFHCGSPLLRATPGLRRWNGEDAGPEWRTSRYEEYFPAKSSQDIGLNKTTYDFWSKKRKPPEFPALVSDSAYGRMFGTFTKDQARNPSCPTHNPADLEGIDQLGYAKTAWISHSEDSASNVKKKKFAPSEKQRLHTSLEVGGSQTDFWKSRYRLDHRGPFEVARVATAPHALSSHDSWCNSSYRLMFQGPSSGLAPQPSAKGSKVERSKGHSWKNCNPSRLAKLEARWSAQAQAQGGARALSAPGARVG